MNFWTQEKDFRPLSLVTLLAVAATAVHCDRGVEPFDPSEEPAPPDLARIYPQGASRTGGPMAGVMGAARPAASPNASAPSEAAAAGGSGKTISGSIEVDDALAAGSAAGGMLFIIARTQPGGPPLAVLRVANPSFPHRFEIGQAQVMIPSLRFAGEIRLSARLDSDGDAMTKLPGDLTGAVENSLVPGSTDVILTLDQKL